MATSPASDITNQLSSTGKAHGYFVYPRYTHNSLLKDYDDSGYISTDIGGWYKLGKAYQLYGYRFPTEIVIQPTFGIEWREFQERYKYQLTLIPKIGKNISFPMTGTGYIEKNVDTEWDFNIGTLITFDKLF